jgi:kynurenine formamidase
MLIDLSYTIEHGMITYKGLPAPLICDFLSRQASRAHYAPGTEFHIGRICVGRSITILLGNDIPIVEHMTGLAHVPQTGFEFFAVPPKVSQFGTFPVRAFAMGRQ